MDIALLWLSLTDCCLLELKAKQIAEGIDDFNPSPKKSYCLSAVSEVTFKLQPNSRCNQLNDIAVQIPETQRIVFFRIEQRRTKLG
jgi:hypothetical protein